MRRFLPIGLGALMLAFAVPSTPTRAEGDPPEPKTAAEYLDRGKARGEAGNFDDARADFDAAIRLEPKNAEAYRHRGVLESRLDRYDRARRLRFEDEAIQCSTRRRPRRSSTGARSGS